MYRMALFPGFFLLVGATAQAEDVWDEPIGWETSWTGESTVLIAPSEDESLLFRLNLGGEANHVLDSGLEIGAVAAFAVEQDHPQRAGFSGIVAAPLRPVIGVQGVFSGLGLSASSEDEGIRGSLETAYVYAQGGYGEIRIGRDAGIAKRFSEGAPSIFTTLSLGAPRLDPTGAAILRTDHDLTGPSAKISYATPRIVGLKAGLSFTPEANARGLDRDPARILPGMPAVSISNATEASVSFNHRFRSNGIRARAAAAWSRADVKAAPTAPSTYSDMTTWSAGGSLEWDGLVAGASWLQSDNGISGRPGDYSAWSAGLSKEALGLTWGLEYGEENDDAVGLDGESLQVGASKAFGESLAIGAGYRRNSLAPSRAGVAEKMLGSEGIVIEITLSR
ncbi:MAG: porin [Hyphomonas sp.]|nr:porin [Hyphomonas sp.]MCB9961918.1 porin [Hyphomonas sp.]MCB9970912.1 porin [Hyphomonas sp.]